MSTSTITINRMSVKDAKVGQTQQVQAPGQATPVQQTTPGSYQAPQGQQWAAPQQQQTQQQQAPAYSHQAPPAQQAPAYSHQAPPAQQAPAYNQQPQGFMQQPATQNFMQQFQQQQPAQGVATYTYAPPVAPSANLFTDAPDNTPKQADPTVEAINNLISKIDQQQQAQSEAAALEQTRAILTAGGVTDPEVLDNLMGTLHPNKGNKQAEPAAQQQQPMTQQQPTAKKVSLKDVHSMIGAFDPVLGNIAGSQAFADYAHNTYINTGVGTPPMTLANMIAAQAGSGDLTQAVSYVTNIVRDFQARTAQPQQVAPMPNFAGAGAPMGGGLPQQYQMQQHQQQQNSQTANPLLGSIQAILSTNPR